MKHLLCTALLAACGLLPAQPDSTRRLTLDLLKAGSSLTYIWDPEAPDYQNNTTYYHREYTWNLNAAVRLRPRLWAGLSSLLIRPSIDREPGRWHWIKGGFLQAYAFRPGAFRLDLYAEAGLNQGNYCTCDPAAPYQRPGLWYASMGAGADYRLTRFLHLDVGFYNYHILNRFPEAYNYTQYVIGLDLRTGLRRRR